MADVKDTVVSHISTQWNGAVVGGSGNIPTIDAVGPEDIEKPEDYPEAILVYNERVNWDRVYNQGQYGDRHTRVYIMVTAHTKSGCTKTHFRDFIDELKNVFNSAMTGYNTQILDPEENVTRTKGHAGGMYQATHVLHLYEYGISTSSPAAAGGAGPDQFRDASFITLEAEDELTNETLLSALPANQVIGSSGALRFQPSGDTDDYLEFLTSADQTEIKVIGESYLTINGDIADLFQVKIGSNTFIGDAKTSSYTRIYSANPIRLMASGDTDDYLEFSSPSADAPHIKTIGYYGPRFESDDAAFSVAYFREDATKYMYLGYNKTANKGVIHSRQELLLQANADTDDYLELSSTGTVPRIQRVGGQDLQLVSDDATHTIIDVLSDTTPTNYLRLQASDTYSIIDNAGAGVLYLRSYGRIYLQPNDDTSYYIDFNTLSNTPAINAIGGNGMIFEAAGTDAFIINGSGEITKIGQDSPSTNDFLQWDGSKVVWTAGGSTDADAIHDNVADEIHQITNKASPAGADELIIEDSAASWAKKRVAISTLPAGSPSFGIPTGDIDIGDSAAEGSSSDATRADHQHAFTAPGAGYPQDTANTEADGTATTPARSDHVHALGAHLHTATAGEGGTLTWDNALAAADAGTHDHSGNTEGDAVPEASITFSGTGHAHAGTTDGSTLLWTEALAAASAGDHDHSDNTKGSNIPEASVTFSATGHDHDGVGSENVDYTDLINRSHDIEGSDHTLAGATAGEYLRADTATTFSVQNRKFSITACMVSPAAGYHTVWRAPIACTVTEVQGRQKGGSSTVINARKNGSTDVLTSDLTLTSANTWYSSTSVQNTAYAVDDWLEVEVVTVGGATEVTIQVEFTEP